MKLVVVLALALAAACESAPREATPPAASPAPSVVPAERRPTRPRPVVANQALGSSRRLVAVAIEDLKALGFWRDLTRHLYRIDISSRPGLEDVPEDGHLADAFLTAYVDEEGRGGAVCDIRFYPAAMEQDLVRQQAYHDRGLVPGPVPSERHFWASILAHELAHCLTGYSDRQGNPRQPGERVARRWEARVLAKAQGEI